MSTRNRLLRTLALVVIVIGLAGGCRELNHPWGALAMCESSGDWQANTGNGYEGGLQFSPPTWRANRQPWMPMHAYEATPDDQVQVAEIVAGKYGFRSQWPDCSRRLGLR